MTNNLPVLMNAVLTSPCKTLFGIVIKLDKFLTALLVPVCTPSGNFLYPSAIGFNKVLSRPWLNEKVALFNFSKQSLLFVICSVFFFV